MVDKFNKALLRKQLWLINFYKALLRKQLWLINLIRPY